MMKLSVSDRLQLHELISLYGHLIDDREFDRLDEVFTTDAVFDLRGYPQGAIYRGIDAIVQLMNASEEHPLAHHASNVVIDIVDDGVSLRSKGLGVGYGGRVGSVVYLDRAVKVGNQWRLSERRVILREPPARRKG